MNPYCYKSRTVVFAAVMLLALAGCGGGGGSGGGASNPQNPPPSAGTGSATLTWAAPTTNTDGSALTNLAGYKVHYGTSAGALNQILDIPNPGTTTATVGGLTTGTWYFTLSDYTNVGVESAQTSPVSKTIS